MKLLRVGARVLVFVVVACWAGGLDSAWAVAGAETRGDGVLRFVRNGVEVGRIDRATLEARCSAKAVEVPRDPYYGKPKRYLACPFTRVLALGFGESGTPLAEEGVLLRAADGYVRQVDGARMREEGAFLAVADADSLEAMDPGAPRWVPIDRRGLSPGPFYLVWTGAGQGDPHRHPWPYQLVEIEIAALDRDFAHTRPTGVPSEDPAWRGFEIFRAECLSCHSINGEGGRVGPELNVPRSIVEYRPPAQLKQYIRNPEAFRYTTMPAHPHLTDGDLDALIAYFGAMKSRKYDLRESGSTRPSRTDSLGGGGAP